MSSRLGHSVLHRLAPTLFTDRPGLPLDVPGPEPGRLLSTGGPLLPWGADPLGHASRLFRRHGPVVALVRGGGTRLISPDASCPGTVLTYGAEFTRLVASEPEIFGKANLSGPLYPGDDPPERKKPLLSFGAGLFAVNGDEHKRQRRLLQPIFSKRRLESYCAEMVRQTHLELTSWQPGQERDAAADMRRLASNLVMSVLFGHTGGGATDDASVALQEALHAMARPITRLAPFDWPLSPFRHYLDATQRLEAGVRGIIEARRGEARESEDMLSALLHAQDEESGQGLTPGEILGHVSVFFAAGHETSANSLTWTLFLLAQFPRVAERVQEEIERELGDRDPSPEDLERLVYLGAVIKESLRLFTPAPWNGRLLLRPARLGDYELPAGTEVLLSIYETHRREPIFRAPLSFHPERWETIKPSVYEYNPFSAGPRICIGAAFATMEMKVVLAMLLRRFRIALLPQRVDRFAEMVLSPKHGMKVRLERADGRFADSSATVRGDVHDMVELPS